MRNLVFIVLILAGVLWFAFSGSGCGRHCHHHGSLWFWLVLVVLGAFFLLRKDSSR